MSKLATDISQSKRLLELGLSPETADMLWVEDYEHIYELEIRQNIVESYNPDNLGRVPAWSFDTLMDIKHDLQGCVTILIKGKDGYLVSIAHPIFMTVMETETTNSPLDAAFEMVCWLLENGHIKTEKK